MDILSKVTFPSTRTPLPLSLSNSLLSTILVSSDSPSFSAASCSWRKNFPFWYCTFYSKLLPTSESLIHLDLFLSMCENGIPSSFPQGAAGALPLFARGACLFSRFAGPSWSQFRFEYFWILCHTPRVYWALMPRPQFSLSRAV